MEDYDVQITDVIPVYDFEEVSGGYFKVYFGGDKEDPFTLGFIPLLDARVKQDDNLFDYLKKTAKDLTASHAIQDLYDIGFPVNDWVIEYIDKARNSVHPEMFDALVRFYAVMRHLGDASGSNDNFEI